MDRGHLSNKHHLEVILRLHTLNDRQHEIDRFLDNFAALRAGIGELPKEASQKMPIRNTERLSEKDVAKGLVWMV